MDDTKLTSLLRATAGTDPLGEIDPEPLVRRGERGVRRRRFAGVTGAVAAIAVATWGVTTVATPGATDGNPPVASPSGTKQATGELFTSVPGVPAGEGALTRISEQEANRRCQLRYPDLGQLMRVVEAGYRGGASLPFSPRKGRRFPPECAIPGGSRPTAAALELATRNPMPADDAGKLLACSVKLWHDIRTWRIVAAETESGLLTNLVAISPSGRYAARCGLGRTLDTDTLERVAIWPTAVLSRKQLAFVAGPGGQTCGTLPRQPCVGWLHDEIGRVTSDIARIRIEKPNGRVHDIEVNDGWYALAWGDRDPKGQPGAKLTAYDANGRVLKTVP